MVNADAAMSSSGEAMPMTVVWSVGDSLMRTFMSSLSVNTVEPVSACWLAMPGAEMYTSPSFAPVMAETSMMSSNWSSSTVPPTNTADSSSGSVVSGIPPIRNIPMPSLAKAGCVPREATAAYTYPPVSKAATPWGHASFILSIVTALPAVSLCALVYQLRRSPFAGLVGSERLASCMPSQLLEALKPLAYPTPFSQVNTAYVEPPSVKTSTPKAPRSSVKLLPDCASCMAEARVGFVALLTFSTVKPVSPGSPPLLAPVATTYGTLFTTNDFIPIALSRYVVAVSANVARCAKFFGSSTSMMTTASAPGAATAACVLVPISNVSIPYGFPSAETVLLVMLPITTGCTGSVMSTTETAPSVLAVTAAYVLPLSV